MDSASEEQMIRLKLEEFNNINSLRFDVQNRRLDIYHTDDYKPIFKALDSLQLKTKFVEPKDVTDDFSPPGDQDDERKLLRQVLVIKSFLFNEPHYR